MLIYYTILHYTIPYYTKPYYNILYYIYYIYSRAIKCETIVGFELQGLKCATISHFYTFCLKPERFKRSQLSGFANEQ